jgi:hypothetical protein
MATRPLAVQSAGSRDSAEEPDPEVAERARQRRYSAESHRNHDGSGLPMSGAWAFRGASSQAATSLRP